MAFRTTSARGIRHRPRRAAVRTRSHEALPWLLAAAAALLWGIDESTARGRAANTRACAGMHVSVDAASFGGNDAAACAGIRLNSDARSDSAGCDAAHAFTSTGAQGVPALDDSLRQVLAEIVDELAEHGFENVAAVAEAEQIVVTYENRLYRYEPVALREVLRRVAARLDTDREIVLVPQRHQTPLLAVSFSCRENECADPHESGTAPGGPWADPDETSTSRDPGAASTGAHSGVTGGDPGAPGAHSGATRRDPREPAADSDAPQIHVTTATGRYWALLQQAERANSSLFKADLALQPQLAVQFGNYNDPVESQVNFVPELNLSLWKGMRASAQLVIPLQNELGEEGDDLRPGLLVVSQLARLPRDVYVVGSVGYFSDNRYGMDLQARRYFNDGRWAVDVNLGYTGRARFLDRTWHYTPVQDVTWQAALEHYVPRYTLLLRAAAARFVYGDQGLRADVLREFGEVHLGIFGIHTDDGSNAGITITLPLPFRKYARPAALRIRPDRTFQWEYRFKGFPQLGESYTTGTPSQDLWYGLSPQFLPSARSLRQIY